MLFINHVSIGGLMVSGLNRSWPQMAESFTELGAFSFKVHLKWTGIESATSLEEKGP